MPDEELVQLARDRFPGSCERLIARYRVAVQSIAHGFFCLGSDREDLVQEGMIGLFKAIRDFDMERPTRFRPFADLCIKRQIQSAVRAAGRQKHLVLNLAKSNGGAAEALESAGYLDCCCQKQSLTDDLFHGMLVTSLTSFECAVVEGYLSGHTYAEMGKIFDCLPKSVDNALQRAKRKISALLVEG